MLFIDEIHRFNNKRAKSKAALLKSVEEGVLVLIGATTENPSFEVISPLLSRCQVYVLNPLSAKELDRILEKIFSEDKLLSGTDISSQARDELIALCGGDARVMLNSREHVMSTTRNRNRQIASSLLRSKELSEIDTDLVKEIFQKTGLLYDRAGEEHYNTISAQREPGLARVNKKREGKRPRRGGLLPGENA